MPHQFEDLSGRILAAAVEVHKALGPGFIESIYHSAMKVPMEHRGIPYVTENPVHLFFEGVELGVQRIDLVIGDEIILEFKAVKALDDIHFAQTKSYLKATGLHVGLLLNFNAPTLVIKRVVLG